MLIKTSFYKDVMKIINQIYGFDCNIVARGKGNCILIMFDDSKIFLTEEELKTEMSKLKDNNSVINVEPFVATLIRHKYDR